MMASYLIVVELLSLQQPALSRGSRGRRESGKALAAMQRRVYLRLIREEIR